MNYSVSELLDMLGIVAIKYTMLEQTLERRAGKSTMAKEQLTALRHSMMESAHKLVQEFDPRLHPVTADIMDLAATNLRIFQAVDIVSSAEDDKVAADAGRKAQTLNLYRSKLKKAIDEYFEGWSKEVKI